MAGEIQAQMASNPLAQLLREAARRRACSLRSETNPARLRATLGLRPNQVRALQSADEFFKTEKPVVDRISPRATVAARAVPVVKAKPVVLANPAFVAKGPLTASSDTGTLLPGPNTGSFINGAGTGSGCAIAPPVPARLRR